MQEILYEENIKSPAQQSVCYCHIDIIVDDMFRLSCSHHQVIKGNIKTIEIYAYEWDPIPYCLYCFYVSLYDLMMATG